MGGNVQVAGSPPGMLHGTILAGGTLSAEIDMSDYSIFGMIIGSTALNGTLSFQVSAFPDANVTPASNYVALNDKDAAAVAATIPTGASAVQATTIISALLGYRYVKIKSSIAQTNGVEFWLPSRA